MTVKELKELIKDYPDNQFVHMRIWLEENEDYLDYDHLDLSVEKVQQGTSGSLLLTGSYKKKIKE